MREIRTALLAFTVAIAFTACAALTTAESNRIAVQYATLKIINNSGDIDAQDVLAATDKVRGILETDVEVDLREIIASIAVDKLTPEDQLLVSVLFQQVRYSVEDVPESVAGASFVERLSVILAWIDEAAALASP